MKKLILFCFALFIGACNNPYLNPQTSKAISEQKQLEQNEAQTQLMQEQNLQLKRIADALEILSNQNSDSLLLIRLGINLKGTRKDKINIENAQDVNIGR
jgi:hypothetical protein